MVVIVGEGHGIYIHTYVVIDEVVGCTGTAARVPDLPCLLLAMRCAGCSVFFIIKKLTTRPSAVDLLEAYEALLVKQAAYIKAPVQHEGVLSPHFEVRCCGTSAGVA